MAASTSWRKSLNEHDLFHNLRQNRESADLNTDSKNLIAIKDGEFYVWNSYNLCLLTVNLKNFACFTEDKKTKHAFQILLCSSAPLFDVESIVFNQTGTLLALVGRRGVMVLQLPQRWGKYAEFEGSKPKILCKTVSIAERLFLTSGERALHVAWHPGSESDRQLVLLTSDNRIRIFNVVNPDREEQVFSFTESDVTLSQSRLACRFVLGEAAVWFDFGPPVELNQKPKPGIGLKAHEAVTLLAWPIYILCGTGDVYMLLTTLDNPRSFGSHLQGPLNMYPPAEDNYGTEACCITCINSRPPVLVIATCEGKLYHCLALNRADDTGSQTELSNVSQPSEMSFYEPVPQISLYVMENIELELSLTTVSVETDEALVDDFGCPIKICKDPGGEDRYYCTHSAGVHAVGLPWLQNITHFCDLADGAELPSLGHNQDAIVEHLVCTKPVHSSPPSPILGLCATADKLLGPTMICLTSNLECFVLPLLETLKTSPPPLLSDTDMKQITSPLKHLYKEQFDTHIRKILQRNASNPILKTSDKAELSLQESFQLLSRSTQVFREEYFEKLDLARQEIERRVRVLREQKGQQQADLQNCQQMKNVLTDKAHALAEKFEEANDRQQQLIYRIETVLKKLQSRLPMLSDAEKNMQRELKDMEKKLVLFKNNIQQLKTKKKYQERQVTSSPRRSRDEAKSGFSKSRTDQLRTVLKEEGDDIAGLVKQVNQMKVGLDA